MFAQGLPLAFILFCVLASFPSFISFYFILFIYFESRKPSAVIRRGQYCGGEAEGKEKGGGVRAGSRRLGNWHLVRLFFPCPSAKADAVPDKMKLSFERMLSV